MWHPQRASAVRSPDELKPQELTPQELKPKEKRSWRPSGRLVLAAKFLVTGLCLWYLGRKIDWQEITLAAQNLKVEWALLTVAALMVQLPLVGLRWAKIVDALGHGDERVGWPPVVAISAIATFFSQIMPSIASESLRVWMLAGQGIRWPRALTSVILDRGIGFGTFLAIGLITMLPSSGLAVSAGIREPLLESLAGILAAAIVCLFLARYLGPILLAWRYTAWAGRLALAAHDVLLASTAGAWVVGLAVAVQLLAILSLWMLGRGLGLSLEIADAGVLFTAIFGAILLPISISGWGVRELAVTALLATAGVPVEKSLLFSVLFGLALLAAGLPGALVWVFYAPGRLKPSPERE